MSTAELHSLIERIKSLSAEERAEVRRAIDAGASPQSTPEQKLDELLLRDGLLEQVPPAISDPAKYDDWKPVPIQGKPLSETIVEERR